MRRSAKTRKADGPSFTELLSRWNEGDRAVAGELLPLIYEELKLLAHRHFRGERRGHTLQPTAVVHEAYLKLESSSVEIRDREHLIGIIARLMRQVLVDYARQRNAEKRGSGILHVTLTEGSEAAPPVDAQVLELEDALQKLGDIDPPKAELVQLRFFGGLSIEETAHCLGISAATVNREWRKARAWLVRELNRGG